MCEASVKTEIGKLGSNLYKIGFDIKHCLIFTNAVSHSLSQLFDFRANLIGDRISLQCGINLEKYVESPKKIQPLCVSLERLNSAMDQI